MRIPPVTKNILIITTLCFFASVVSQRYGIDLNNLLGLHFFMASDFNLVQLITYMFMHANFQHIFFNMFAVWMFGRIMETEWGSKRFLIFYLLCGIGAGLTQELCQFVHYEMVLAKYSTVNMGGIIVPMSVFLDEIVTVGASGAVYGILLGYGLTFPDNALFIIPFPFPIKAKWLVLGYVILELGLGIRQNAADNVAHFAHLGGMLAGFLIMLYWKRKDRKRDDNNMTFKW